MHILSLNIREDCRVLQALKYMNPVKIHKAKASPAVPEAVIADERIHIDETGSCCFSLSTDILKQIKTQTHL